MFTSPTVMPNNDRDLTNAQWEILDSLNPQPTSRSDGRGRPWRDRAVLNGILWILRTGAPWADVPDRYPSYQTCHRRFQQWGSIWSDEESSGGSCVDLKARGVFDVREAFIDGSFAPAKKRDSKVGKTKRGKGTKIMAVADRHGLPVAVHVESATPHEVKLALPTLVRMVVPEGPQNLVGDNAYDSDQLDAELNTFGIELISPHRSNRKNKTQDLRRLRRYRRRWKIERLFAWLQNFRRLVVRYERYAENFLGMLHLGCCIILLRHL